MHQEPLVKIFLGVKYFFIKKNKKKKEGFITKPRDTQSALPWVTDNLFTLPQSGGGDLSSMLTLHFNPFHSNRVDYHNREWMNFGCQRLLLASKIAAGVAGGIKDWQPGRE